MTEHRAMDEPNTPDHPTAAPPPTFDQTGDLTGDRAVDLTPTTVPGREPAGAAAAPKGVDPLRLCIFATIALLAWLGGPWALAFFAALGFGGYWRARRAGLLRSKCLLGDTRLVLVYLAVLFLVSSWGIWSRLTP